MGCKKDCIESFLNGRIIAQGATPMAIVLLNVSSFGKQPGGLSATIAGQVLGRAM
jgi:hypothetical protein